MPIFYLIYKKTFCIFSLRKIFIFILLYSLIGIDKEEYFEEGCSPWFPIFFIKHGISFDIIFKNPITPYYIMYDAELTPEKSDKLNRYCQIRYGVNLSECKSILHSRMTKNGFYKPE